MVLAQHAGAQTQATPQSSQTGEGVVGASVSGETGDRIDDIVVTAQKRRETAQTTPLSIGVITGADLARKGQGSVEAGLRDVPSVEIQGLAQGAQIYVRGVGSSIDPSYADPAIALMVDGVYNGRTEAVTSGAYDIDRIEVLRGPQGTLYGRNASGGIVNVLTTNPSTDRYSGYLRGTLGNYNLRRLEGAVNAPFSDALAIRISGFREKRDGYVDDGSSDFNAWGIRAKVLYTPASWLKIIGKVDIYREHELGANTVPVPGSAGNLTFPPPYFFTMTGPRFPNGWVQRTPGDPWSNDPEHTPGYTRRNGETYEAEIDANLGFGTLTLLPSYSRAENALTSSFLFGSVLPFAGPTYTVNSNYQAVDTVTEYKSIEARLGSNGRGPLKYVAGFYYLATSPGSPNLPTTTTTNEGESLTFNNIIEPGSTIAGFGQVTYSVLPKLRVTGGVRYSEDKNNQKYYTAVGTADPVYNSYSHSQSAVQYKVGLEYDLAPRSLLYAHVSTGFKQGGISTTTPPIPFQPEHLTATEIGSKNQLFDNRLQLNFSAFHYSYRGYQLGILETLQVGSFNATASYPVIVNTGPTHINGAEAEAQFVPWRKGHFTTSITYLDAKYGNAPLPNNPFVNQGSDFNLEGRQIQDAPTWSGNLAFEQGFDIGTGTLTAGVHTHLTTGYFVSPEQYLPGAHQPGFSRTDLNFNYAFAKDHLNLGLWIRNVEGEAQTTYVFPAYRRFITAPRTIGGTLGAKF